MNSNVCYSLVVPLLAVQADTHSQGIGSKKNFNDGFLLLTVPSIIIMIQHDGTGTWFIQCSKFREWKKTGSLLWISGNRKLLPPILSDGTLRSSIFQPVPVKAYFGARRFVAPLI